VTRDRDICSQCAAMSNQDALAIQTLEIVSTIHNACAPVTHYACRCRTCDTRWLAIEVFDEEGDRPSEWSWQRDTDAPPATS
jgi:hypothetical protein